MDYSMQFFDTYPDVRKLMRIHISDAHENTGEVIKYADQDFVNFFQKFYEKGHLNTTQVIFISDHGAHFFVNHMPFIPDDSRRQENAFPILIHLAPKWIAQPYKDNMITNEQRLIDSHDIYSTLKSIAVGKQARSVAIDSHSYIYAPMPAGRDCIDTDLYYQS